ncbi:MAG: 50S ribosomal protein L18 [Bacteroidia bacterium]
MNRLEKKISRRDRIKRGIRKKVYGTSERPRLTVYRSNKEIYAQVIDDEQGHTLASASSKEAEVQGQYKGRIEQARMVGKLLATKVKDSNISKVAFDRNGYLYHGRIKALAEGAREGGITI